MQIEQYRSGDEWGMERIAPRAFGVWARYGIDYSLPREAVSRAYSEEALEHARQA